MRFIVACAHGSRSWLALLGPTFGTVAAGTSLGCCSSFAVSAAAFVGPSGFGSDLSVVGTTLIAVDLGSVERPGGISAIPGGGAISFAVSIALLVLSAAATVSAASVSDFSLARYTW